MTLLFELNLDAGADGRRTVSAGLYRQLKAAILDGRLKPGAKLPPTRRAPDVLGVSRNTAADVYERLLHEGMVVARHGSGTYVAETLPLPAPAARPASGETPDPRLNPVWLERSVADAIGFWREGREPAAPQGIELRPALIDPKLFPFAAFRQVMARQLRRMERRPAAFKSPQGNQGNFHLRQAIAEHVALTRAVACRAEDVAVTAGAQQAFDLIARILVKPGETVVAVEDPGYPPMRAAFAAAGAQIVPVPVDAQGLRVEALPDDAGIVCVCPSHQFPLGMSMPPARRKALLDFARRRGAIVVEDDYDGEFRYDGSPLEALRNAESAEQVFYVGTFSKCMLPALRLGFVVPPPWALPALVAAKNVADWHCPAPLQMAVGAFISDGHLARHVRRMRRAYGERRRLLIEALGGALGERLEIIPSYYGMHVAAFARDEALDCEGASAQLAERGINLHALGRYHLAGGGRPGFIFGFGAAAPAELRAGLAALEEALGRG